MKIREIKVNSRNKIRLLLTGLEERKTSRGNSYLSLDLTDGDKILTANLWDTQKDNFKSRLGVVLDLELEAKEYRGGVSYSVASYEETPDAAEDYVVSAPLPAEKMFNEIYRLAASLGDFSSITQQILSDNKDKLLYWGAGKTVHHNVCAGLLYHVYRMLQLASRVEQVYRGGLNRNLLYAGTILHDIGKLQELSCTPLGEIDYTPDGNLFGHLYLGAEMIEKYASEVSDENIRLLKHMIVSHHGKVEYGAISLPAIPEAAVLNHIDMIDSELYQYEQAQKEMTPGTMSEKLFGLGTRIYFPNL